MSEFQHQDYMQSSLLDRLTDDEPDKKKVIQNKRGLSQTKLRENILRDLNWLFNSSNLATVVDLNEYPQIESSVLNYGIPDFTGHLASGVNVSEIEKLLKQAICNFEPRILRRSIKVRLSVDEKKMAQNAMLFDIEGELWADPYPLKFYLKTNLDFEVGEVKIYDYSGMA